MFIRDGGGDRAVGGLVARSDKVLHQRDTAAGLGRVSADGRVPVRIVYPRAGGDEGAG